VKNGLFDSNTLMRLCDILDKSGGWQHLAELLDYKFLVTTIRDTASPSKLLFNYADVSVHVRCDNTPARDIPYLFRHRKQLVRTRTVYFVMS
jgi:hypothetical protein